MKKIVIVGSGASAVHFALSVLEKGHEVTMLDVGRPKPTHVLPDVSLAGLKDQLANPVDYFLGERFESVLLPGSGAEYYGFPPSKTYVFSEAPQYRWQARGFAPLASFARGGLAEAWTGGSYPFSDAELRAFPFSYAEIGPYYAQVARRIGISGAIDDLARFMPVHDHIQPPLDLDEHSQVLLEAYQRRRPRLNAGGVFMGRSRLATLSREHDGRGACQYLGRCLWGCPRSSLYTPSMTLAVCQTFDRFRYVPDVYVRHFTIDRRQRAEAVVVETATGVEQIPVETLVLGAGALGSCRIFLESIYRMSGEKAELRGLMDNPQVLMPFVNLGMLRRRFEADSYQYHQLGLGIEGAAPDEYVHGQITTLKTALIHPIVQKMPFDLKTSLAIFKNLHAALGLVNINLHDRRRETNAVTIEPDPEGGPSRLLIHYEVDAAQRERTSEAMRRVRKVLWSLNCVVPPGMSHVRPMGASVHYAGMLPMSATSDRWTTAPDGRSHDIENLYVVDGATFPFLPAKNLTFTLMANAARIADQAF